MQKKKNKTKKSLQIQIREKQGDKNQLYYNSMATPTPLLGIVQTRIQNLNV